MKMLLALLILVTTVAVSAQTRIVSIDAFDYAYTGGLMFKHNEGKHSNNDLDSTTFKINLNYAQNLANYVGVMWKAKAYYNHESIDFGTAKSKESTLGAAGGLLYNLQPEDIKNSFMASAMAGMEHASYDVPGGVDESGFNLFMELEAGKRFDLGQYSVANISYAPTVALMVKRYGGDIRDRLYKNGSEIKFNFLKFDILF